MAANVIAASEELAALAIVGLPLRVDHRLYNCAAAVAAIRYGNAAPDVQVVSPGGAQRVEWRDDGVYLTGWAEVVFDGVWILPADLPLV